MNIKLLNPSHWTDYELIDSGAFEKLERFGRYVIARPEPQAIWNKSLSDEEWHQRADAYFKKDKKNEDRGEWVCKPKMLQQWFVNYRYGDMALRMRLGLTSFKHVGIFPEQAENWDFIFEQVKRIGTGAKVLNLFAYTGGATLAAKSAGADVTHETRGVLGTGKHGSLRFGRGTLDRGGCFEIRASGSAAREKI